MAMSPNAAALFAFLAAPGLLLAQGGVPLGPEFRVNTFTTAAQNDAAVAFDSAGNFVIAWQGASQDGSGDGVFAQRYASGGTPLGGEFRVNTFTISGQGDPAVACDAAGNFVLVWDSYGQDGDKTGVFAQRYASTGAPLGGEFRVNTYTTSGQRFPAVVSDPLGNFVVVWDSGFYPDIFAQRYASTGAPLGGEFRVNAYTTGAQVYPAVASDAAGNFVVVWRSSLTPAGSHDGVFGQRYASTGAPLGTEFQVTSFTVYAPVHSTSVASDATGNFVVAWDRGPQLPSDLNVFGQRYDNTGSPLGGEFRINTYTTLDQASPWISSDLAGNFVVTWGSNGSFFGIFGQRYTSAGTPLGGEFRINTYTAGSPNLPVVGSDPSGRFVVLWTSYGQDGSSQGVFAQRYSMIVPVELQSFRVE